MPLRTPNNPTTDLVVLNALVGVVLGLWGDGGVAQSANTQLAVASVAQGGDATGADRVFVQDEYALTSANRYPCVLLSSGQQAYVRQSWRNYDGQLVASIDYYQTWPSATTETNDQIRADVAADLERIKANIESNDSLTQNGVDYTVSTVKFTLSPYQGMFKQYGAQLYIYRTLTVVFNLLPYDV